MYIVYFGIKSLSGEKRGVENVILTQMKAIPQNEYIYIHLGSKTEVYRNENRNVINISIKNNIFRIITLNLIFFKLKNIKYVHSHSYVLTIFLLRKTDFFTVHDGLFYQYKSLKSFKQYLFYFIEILAYFKSKHITFVSNFSKKKSLFKHNIPFSIIPNTSHLEDLLNSYTEINNLFLPFTDYVLVVKNFDKRANHELLVEAAKKSNYNFVFVGTGELFDKIKNQVKNEQNIYLTGYVTDLELCKLYANAKFTINCALYGEGFGLPIIESYLFNKLCLASNICAIPEVIIDNNHLFHNDLDHLMCAMNLIKNNSDNFNYFKYYNNNFSNLAVVTKYKVLYSSYSL